jgi:hypothetical protein
MHGTDPDLMIFDHASLYHQNAKTRTSPVERSRDAKKSAPALAATVHGSSFRFGGAETSGGQREKLLHSSCSGLG